MSQQEVDRKAAAAKAQGDARRANLLPEHQAGRAGLHQSLTPCSCDIISAACPAAEQSSETSSAQPAQQRSRAARHHRRGSLPAAKEGFTEQALHSSTGDISTAHSTWALLHTHGSQRQHKSSCTGRAAARREASMDSAAALAAQRQAATAQRR